MTTPYTTWTKQGQALISPFGRYVASVRPHWTLDHEMTRVELGYRWTITTSKGAVKAQGIQPTQDAALTACEDRIHQPINNRY